MPLFSALLTLLLPWSACFAQRRSAFRAISQSLGLLLATGRRTLSSSLFTRGLQNQDWSAEYKLHSRARWFAEALFQPLLQQALPYCPDPFIAVAIDDTHIRKTGHKILSASFQRDPLSPKFRFNLMWGLRFLHLAVLLPLYRFDEHVAPRAIPIRFLEVPAIKKPGKKASPDQLDAYRVAVRDSNLSQHSLTMLGHMRQSLDQLNLTARPLLVVGDGSFCNRTLLRACLDRTYLLLRARKNIRLCHRAPQPGRAFYGSDKFTPEQVRLDESIQWQVASVFHGGQFREIRYKCIPQVYWQSAAGRNPLRLFVIAPTPYASGKGTRKYYRDPAYLLTQDLLSADAVLLQPYFDRWQIEVSHRELKDTLGVGQAQLRNKQSVSRQPAMMVAVYSALHLAALKVFGLQRPTDSFPLPKWRRKANRPSCGDLLRILRKEFKHPDLELLRSSAIKLDVDKLLAAAGD